MSPIKHETIIFTSVKNTKPYSSLDMYILDNRHKQTCHIFKQKQNLNETLQCGDL
jgi:hypothetical protein